jgi:hypothetical protein
MMLVLWDYYLNLPWNIVLLQDVIDITVIADETFPLIL